MKLLMTSLPHVSGMLVNVLDPQLTGCPKQHRILVPDKPNNFRGILDWKKKIILFWLPLFIVRLRESCKKLLLSKWHKLWIFRFVAQSKCKRQIYVY